MSNVGNSGKTTTSRPGAISACAALLCSAWVIAAAITSILLASAVSRLSELNRLSTLSDQDWVESAVQRLELQSWLVLGFIVAASAPLCYAIPRLFRGRQVARVSLWVGIPLLIVEPLRQVILELTSRPSDTDASYVSMIFFVFIFAALALLGIGLLALPSVSTYMRAPQFPESSSRTDLSSK